MKKYILSITVACFLSIQSYAFFNGTIGKNQKFTITKNNSSYLCEAGAQCTIAQSVRNAKINCRTGALCGSLSISSHIYWDSSTRGPVGVGWFKHCREVQKSTTCEYKVVKTKKYYIDYHTGAVKYRWITTYNCIKLVDGRPGCAKTI